MINDDAVADNIVIKEWGNPEKAPFKRRLLVKGILIDSASMKTPEKIITVGHKEKFKTKTAESHFWLIDKFEKFAFKCEGWMELPDYE